MVRIWSANWGQLCYEQITLEQHLTTPNSEKIIPQATFVSQKATEYESTLFPNPAQSAVNLTLPDFIGEQGEILVYNNLGQMVSAIPLEEILAHPIKIDIQSLEAGLYHVQAVINDGIKVHHKLVVKR